MKCLFVSAGMLYGGAERVTSILVNEWAKNDCETRILVTRTEKISKYPLAQNVEVVSFNGLLVDLAKRNNARVILKGLRAVSDFEYEFQMALMNSQLDSDVETLFMTTSAANSFLSSSSVKQVAKFGGKINGLVPDEIVDDVIRKIKG